MLLRRDRLPLTGYLLGAGCARIGDEMIAPTVLLIALAAADPHQSGPALVAAITGAAALGGPFLGSLLDRSPHPMRVLSGALVGFALLLAATGSLIGRAPVVAVVGVATLAGLLRPALSGGWSSRLPDLAGRRLPRATALDAITFDSAALAGPALVAVVAATLGRHHALWTALGLIALAAPMAWLLERSGTGFGRPPGDRRGSLFAGLRAIVAIPALRRATSVSVISYIGVGVLVTSLPLLGRHLLGAADRGPLLLTLMAVAALCATTVYAHRPTALHPETVLMISTLLMAGAMALGAFAARTALSAGDREPHIATIVLLGIAMIITGLADGPQLVALMHIRHRESPAGARSQVFTTGASLKLGGLALGAAASSPLSTWSLPGALLVAAGCQLAATLIQLRR